MEFKDYISIIRPTGWALTFISVTIGALLAFKNLDFSFLSNLFLTILIIGPLLGGGLYTLNSIYDIKFDRKHPIKKKLSLASGKITKKEAWTIFLIHALLAFILSIVFDSRLLFIVLLMIILQTIYCCPPFRQKEKKSGIIFSGPLNHVLRIMAGFLVINESLKGFPIIFVAGLWFFFNSKYLLYKFIDLDEYKKSKYDTILIDENPKKTLIRLSILILISISLINLSFVINEIHYRFLLMNILISIEWFGSIIYIHSNKYYSSDKYPEFVKGLKIFGILGILVTILVAFLI